MLHSPKSFIVNFKPDHIRQYFFKDMNCFMVSEKNGIKCSSGVAL